MSENDGMRWSRITCGLLLVCAVAAAGEVKPTPAQIAADELAGKLPDKKLEDAKLFLSSNLGKALVKHLRGAVPGAATKKVLLVGPGIASGKERFVPKSSESRAYAAGPASVTGNIANTILLQALPEVLAKERPGYVLFAGLKGRKARSELDMTDWYDACLLCLRYGAVPILGLPDTPEADDPMRVLFAKTANNTVVPAIDLNAANSPELLALMLKLLDQYVLQLPDANVATPKVKPSETDE